MYNCRYFVQVMALTVDDVMEKIGSFARYQYRLLFIFGFMKIFGDAFQAMIPIFLSVEPPWRCKDNSSECNLTGIFNPGDENYKFRCSIPRDQWEFDTSELNSVVTEVGGQFCHVFLNFSACWLQWFSELWSEIRRKF